MRDTVRTIALALGALVLAAGCTQQGDPQEAAGPRDIQLDPDSGLGAVRGAVLSEDNLPIAGAQVGLQETGATARTDETGAFLLADVPAGSYMLLAAAIGHEAAARPIEVRAGQATDVALTLVAAAMPGHAHVEVLQHVGFFECALATEVWISSCSYPYTAAHGAARDAGANLTSLAGLPADVQQNIHRFNVTVRPGIGMFVAELTWQPVSAASNRMMILVLCGDYDPVFDECYDGIRYGEDNGWQGEDPVQARINGTEFYEQGNGTEKWDLNKGPIWVMNYLGLPWGDPQLAFQQKFEVWDSVFYYSEAPSDYTALAVDV